MNADERGFDKRPIPQALENEDQADRQVIARMEETGIELTTREQRLVDNCLRYAAHDPAGLPGHNLMLIIAKLERRRAQLEGVARWAYDLDRGIAEFLPEDPEAISESLGYLEQALLAAGFEFPGD